MTDIYKMLKYDEGNQYDLKDKFIPIYNIKHNKLGCFDMLEYVLTHEQDTKYVIQIACYLLMRFH